MPTFAGDPVPNGDLGPELAAAVHSRLRDVPDFPQPGVLFKDIGPLLADAAAFEMAIEGLAMAARAGGRIDLISGVEARGFVLAAALARHLNCGLVLVRKAGKLPPPTLRRDYVLEYGNATLEVPAGSVAGRDIYLVDDVLATGGTIAAAHALLREAGGRITGVGMLMELEFLGGRAVLEAQEGLRLTSLLRL